MTQTAPSESTTAYLTLANRSGPSGAIPRRRKAAWRLVALYLVLLAVSVGLGFASPHDDGVTVVRQQFGAAWPLTVPEGILRCEFGREVTFHEGGTTYSLNRAGKHRGYSGVGPLRAEDPAGGKKDLAPLIERGLQVCR